MNHSAHPRLVRRNGLSVGVEELRIPPSSEDAVHIPMDAAIDVPVVGERDDDPDARLQANTCRGGFLIPLVIYKPVNLDNYK